MRDMREEARKAARRGKRKAAIGATRGGTRGGTKGQESQPPAVAGEKQQAQTLQFRTQGETTHRQEEARAGCKEEPRAGLPTTRGCGDKTEEEA